MAHPLDGCRAKLERAAEHLAQLQPEYDEWFGDGSGIIETTEADERGPDSRLWLVSRCRRVLREPPARWGLIAGDAIQNTRAALDHLACRLVEQGGHVPDTRTSFPIWRDDPTVRTGTRQQFERSLRGMRGVDAEAIRALQPYQDPSSPHSAGLLTLQALSNLDKHRVILPTLMTFGESIPLATWSVTPTPDEVAIQVNRGTEIAPGAELARARTTSGRPEMGVHAGFEIRIAFKGVYHMVHLAELREIRSYVAGIVESFSLVLASSSQRVRICATGSVVEMTRAMEALRAHGQVRVEDPAQLASGGGNLEVVLQGVADETEARSIIQATIDAVSTRGGSFEIAGHQD